MSEKRATAENDVWAHEFDRELTRAYFRESMRVRAFHNDDESSVIALWEVCGLVVPQNDPKKDIARKHGTDSEGFLVGELDGAIIGSCMVGYDGHRGWINYLAVHPDHQRSGYASELMSVAETLLRERGCPKINLQVRTSNVSVRQFYEQLGFALDEVVSFGKRLESDRPPRS